MASAARSLSACLASAEALLQEHPTRLVDLVGETVSEVIPHRHGTCIRFGSGATIVIPSGGAFDAAGLPVIEP